MFLKAASASALLYSVPTFIFSCSVVGLCILVKTAFWIRIAWAQASKKARVPGPLWARWTRLWIAKVLYTGKSHEIWVDVNKKYGPVARIGPNHVLTDDPSITRHVLAARSGYVRGPWFDSVRIDPHIPNIVSERDVKQHRKIRAKMAPSFMGKSVAQMEPAVDQMILLWIDTLRKKMAASEEMTFDIGRRIQFLTVDIITKVCLGDEIGCIINDRDMYGILETVEVGSQACQYFSIFLVLNSLFFQLARIPTLRKALFPKPCDSTGVGRLMGIVHEAVEKHAMVAPCRDNVVSSLLRKGMSKEQIDSEIVIALVAGSDTTSTSVQSTLLCIISNPQIYDTLTAEVRNFVLQRDISNPVKYADTKHLPYLHACVMEGLRKHPPLSQLRERVVPKGGDTLGGFPIPGGTFVGLNTWGTQLNKDVYGEDAELFRPERWLIEDTDRLFIMNQTHSLIFGDGTTKCLGAAMAMMEISKIIFELIRNFDISVANPHKPWISKCYGIFFQKDFRVRIRDIRDIAPPAYHDTVGDSSFYD